MSIEIFNKNCIDLLREMAAEGRKVDAIVTDPPYMYLKNQVIDKPYDIDEFMKAAASVTDRIIFFGRGDMFYKMNTAAAENGFIFREEIVWNKRYTSTFTNAVMRVHETISIRTKKGAPKINKVKTDYFETRVNNDEVVKIIHDFKRMISGLKNEDGVKEYLEHGAVKYFYDPKFSPSGLTCKNDTKTLPRPVKVAKTLIEGACVKSIITCLPVRSGALVATEKPVSLLETLIRIISNEGETILDPFAGSGSTGEACHNTGRNFIGCEIDSDHFKIAKTRLKALPGAEVNEGL